ncbi:PREDICTED: uncharacterized protein LOC109159373 isoform X3 [Ipomoea nil]|uniref:uncharacterized protein LOC109159373 isoform X3 n=1 Tax=Ipomoea nil TaxID=35883 RepID=UPI000901C911|nr:PREDICTED: uncharacterized protein LOC109159373 isoform X3 [Ipomoea nil]XP_019163030.1 PREDICTED: uncharacterized protein LOC109159373 isoform X3 [Ipomoea nil]
MDGPDPYLGGTPSRSAAMTGLYLCSCTQSSEAAKKAKVAETKNLPELSSSLDPRNIHLQQTASCWSLSTFYRLVPGRHENSRMVLLCNFDSFFLMMKSQWRLYCEL